MITTTGKQLVVVICIMYAKYTKVHFTKNGFCAII